MSYSENKNKIDDDFKEFFAFIYLFIFFKGYRIPIVGFWLGRSFIVEVSEPKSNRPNTMNLVKNWAQELGLSEGFFSGLTGS